MAPSTQHLAAQVSDIEVRLLAGAWCEVCKPAVVRKTKSPRFGLTGSSDSRGQLLLKTARSKSISF